MCDERLHSKAFHPQKVKYKCGCEATDDILTKCPEHDEPIYYIMRLRDNYGYTYEIETNASNSQSTYAVDVLESELSDMDEAERAYWSALDLSTKKLFHLYGDNSEYDKWQTWAKEIRERRDSVLTELTCPICGDHVSAASRTELEKLYRYHKHESRENPLCRECKKAKNKKQRKKNTKIRHARKLQRAYVQNIPYSGYLVTPFWQSKRRHALRRAGYSCQLCGEGGELHVHHRTYENLGRECMRDLIVLCRECHYSYHKN